MKNNVEMRVKPTQKRAINTINKIKNTTRYLLKKIDSDSITTNLIAEKSNISIGSIYNYYPNKESIISDCFVEIIEEIKIEIVSIVRKGFDLDISYLAEKIIIFIFNTIEHEAKYPKTVLDILLKEPDFLEMAVVKVSEVINLYFVYRRKDYKIENTAITSYVLAYSAFSMLGAHFREVTPEFSKEELIKEISIMVSARLNYSLSVNDEK